MTMNKITYKKISYNRIDDNFLNGYIRFQEIVNVLYIENGEFSRELKNSVKNGSILYAAYDQKQIIGFSMIDSSIFFDEYVNMSYIHTSKGYRGYGIGKYLFNIMALESKKLGAKKLYISAHPAVESQKFYQSIGCVSTKKVNQELYDLEPYDLHLEYSIQYVEEINNLIRFDLAVQGNVTAKTIGKTASRLYKFVPKKETEFLSVVEELISIKERGFFSVGTLMVKRNNDVIHEGNMEFFNRSLLSYVCEWYEVDQYCTRILSPMIALNDNHYQYLLNWSDSINKDVRRASLVAMIKPSNSGLILEYDFDKMIYLVEKLKNDKDIHVRKAVGWVLKCSYFKYPNKLEKYLRSNVSNLDRLIFRYALEHIENPLRKELINL
jgi:3-methyladenine DNA glycosylase AlkD/ribosomal protein S18 acetylase RimI-like enzyme